MSIIVINPLNVTFIGVKNHYCFKQTVNHQLFKQNSIDISIHILGNGSNCSPNKIRIPFDVFFARATLDLTPSRSPSASFALSALPTPVPYLRPPPMRVSSHKCPSDALSNRHSSQAARYLQNPMGRMAGLAERLRALCTPPSWPEPKDRRFKFNPKIFYRNTQE